MTLKTETADLIIPKYGKDELEYLITTYFESISQNLFQRPLEEIFWYKRE